MFEEKGRIETVDGTFEVSWDHTDNYGQLTYNVIDYDDGNEYVARYDDGWRACPKGFTTVDYERLIPTTGEWDTLIDALNRASGRAPVPGIHNMKGGTQ
jgi:hypothetical protein